MDNHLTHTLTHQLPAMAHGFVIQTKHGTITIEPDLAGPIQDAVRQALESREQELRGKRGDSFRWIMQLDDAFAARLLELAKAGLVQLGPAPGCSQAEIKHVLTHVPSLPPVHARLIVYACRQGCISGAGQLREVDVPEPERPASAYSALHTGFLYQTRCADGGGAQVHAA